MRLSTTLLLVLPLFVLSGCLSGDSYPERYAAAYCGTLFACFEADSVEDITGHDDAGDCSEEVAQAVRDRADYDQWEEGDASFDSDAASACIEEVSEFRADGDCAGEELNLFSYGAFIFDVAHEDCDSVYE